MTLTQKIVICALIFAALYAAGDSDALADCEKLHSRETCLYASLPH